MKTAVYYNNNDVRLEEMEKPKIGPDELLVKVYSSGICGSDVLEWYRIKKAPLVLGHEIAGEIVEVGENVKKYKVGQRVFVSHHIPCNTCHYCLNGYHTACETLHTTNYYPGGFSEYIKVPSLNVQNGVFVLPDEISYDEGAFIEPLACVVRGQRIAQLKPAQSILILGAGISGLLHLILARALGAGTIVLTDISDYRLNIAKKFGATEVLSANDNIQEKFKKINNGKLADLVIVCTGALSAFKQALDSVDRGGTILCFATTAPDEELPVPINKFWRNEIKLMPSYGNSPYDAEVAIELIRTKRVSVKEMITHKLPLKDTGKGFKLVTDAKDCIKVIINPNN